MSGAIAWFKKYGVIVACGVVVVASIAAGYVVSSGMNTSAIEKLQADVTRDSNALRGANLNYKIPSAIEGEEGFSASDAPNQRVIARVAAARERYRADLETITAEIVEFNRKGRVPLVDGLFPEPAPSRELLARTEMQNLMLGRNKDGGGALRALIASAGGGTPPDGDELEALLQTMFDTREERILATTGEDDLTREQEDDLRQQLTGARISYYTQRAAELGFYVSPDLREVFPEWDEMRFQPPPDLLRCWDLQLRYWVYEDLLSVIQRLNGSGTSGVASSAVKELKTIAVWEPDLFDADRRASQSQGGGGALGGSRNREKNEQITEVPNRDHQASKTYTGRYSGRSTGNKVYDIRYVTFSVVMDADRVLDLCVELRETNLMTVLGVDIDAFDATEWLPLGYVYGNHRLVEATFEIETIWLREWTTQFMPPRVRAVLRVPEDGPNG